MEKQQPTPKFWSRKNIVFLLIGLIITIIMIVVSVLFVNDIDFNEIFNKINHSLKTIKLAGLWLFLLLFFSIFRAFCFSCLAVYDAHKNKIKIAWWKWILYAFSLVFLNAVTPFAVGSEPFSIYFLNKNGYHNIKKVSALLLVCSTFYQVGQVLITIPSFIYINYELISYAVINQQYLPFYYYLALAGILVDFAMTAVYFSLGFSRKIHYFIALIINKIKKIMKLKYLNKHQIKQEQQLDSSFKYLYLGYLKNKVIVISALLIGIIYNLFIYMLMYFSFSFLHLDNQSTVFDLFNYTNISVTATNFVPIPGSEGSIQYILKQFLVYDPQNIIRSTNNYFSATQINDSIFIWRTFSLYCGALVGMVCFSCFVVYDLSVYIKKVKYKKTNNF